MAYNGMSDSSGTDDDLPPIHRNRFQRGARPAGNTRTVIDRPQPLPAMPGDMEAQIHVIEQEAYCAIIRAFRAQSDVISWEKESFITELRKELRVSDEENRELLTRVNGDETIRRIREWRKSNDQPNFLSTSQRPYNDPIPSSTVSASHKKRKTSQSADPLPMAAPHPTIQPSKGTLLRPPPRTARIKKSKSRPHAGRTRNLQGGNRVPESTNKDHLTGMKVWTRWPDDNNFYEAVITDYNPTEDRHALVYDINTEYETWEWVNLKEISPKDIRWEGEDPEVNGRGVNKKPIPRSGRAVASIGRGKGDMKSGIKENVPLSQNGIERKKTRDIQIRPTEALIKKVEKVIGSNQPDLADLEKAKIVLQEQEQALLDAITLLEGASDGESDQMFENGDMKR